MRTKLLSALTFLCVAQIAQAQQYPMYGYAGYQQPYPAYNYYGYPQQYAGYGYGYAPGVQQFAPSGQQSADSVGYNAFSQAVPTSANAWNDQAGQNGGGIYPNAVNAPAYGYPGSANPNNYGYGYPQYPTGIPGQQNAADGGTTPLPNAPGPEMAMGQPQYNDTGMLPGYPLTPGGYGGADRPYQQPNDPDAFHRPTNQRFWASADYMMAWFRTPNSAGPLVTTGSAQNANPGALGQPSTAVLFGDRPFDFGMFSGVSGQVGIFLDSCDSISLDAAGFCLFTNDIRFNLSSDANGNPVIARPVTNAATGNQISYLDAVPGLISGGVSVLAKSELLGGELNATLHAYPSKWCMWEGLIGFRYVRLAESLTIQDHLTPLVDNVVTFEGVPVAAGDLITDEDRFRTSNDFYGMQLGTRFRFDTDWFNITAFGKAALGATQQQVTITGSSSLFSAEAGNQVASGGILALPSNIGQHDRTTLGFVSELGATFGVNICCHCEVTATYSFLYWNQVVRPSAQIDRSVNVGQVPTDIAFGQVSGPPRPAFNFNEEMFWAHSLSFGLVFHY